MADPSSSYDDLFEAETCDIAYVPLLDFDFVDDCFLADPPTTPIVDCPDVDIPPEYPPPPPPPEESSDSATSSDSSAGCPEFTGDVTINMLPGGATPTGTLTIALDSTDPCTYIAELDLGIPSGGFTVPDDCPTFNFTGSVTVDGDPGTMDITVTPNHGATCEYDVDIDMELPAGDGPPTGEAAIYEIDIRCEEGLLNKYARQVTIGITDNVLTATTGGWVFLSQEGCCECPDDSTSSSGQDNCYTIYDCAACPGGVPSMWTITGAGFANDAPDFFCDCNLFDGTYPLVWSPDETHPCRWNYNDGVIDIEMYFSGDTVTITYTVVNCPIPELDPIRVIYEGTNPCNAEATIGVLSEDLCVTHPSSVTITPCEAEMDIIVTACCQVAAALTVCPQFQGNTTATPYAFFCRSEPFYIVYQATPKVDPGVADWWSGSTVCGDYEFWIDLRCNEGVWEVSVTYSKNGGALETAVGTGTGPDDAYVSLTNTACEPFRGTISGSVSGDGSGAVTLCDTMTLEAGNPANGFYCDFLITETPTECDTWIYPQAVCDDAAQPPFELYYNGTFDDIDFVLTLTYWRAGNPGIGWWYGETTLCTGQHIDVAVYIDGGDVSIQVRVIDTGTLATQSSTDNHLNYSPCSPFSISGTTSTTFTACGNTSTIAYTLTD